MNIDTSSNASTLAAAGLHMLPGKLTLSLMAVDETLRNFKTIWKLFRITISVSKDWIIFYDSSRPNFNTIDDVYRQLMILSPSEF